MRNFCKMLGLWSGDDSQYQEINDSKTEAKSNFPRLKSTYDYLKSLGWKLPVLLTVDGASAVGSYYLIKLCHHYNSLALDARDNYYSQPAPYSNQTCFETTNQDIWSTCPISTDSSVSLIDVVNILNQLQNSTIEACNDLASDYCSDITGRVLSGFGASALLLIIFLPPCIKYCQKILRCGEAHSSNTQTLFNNDSRRNQSMATPSVVPSPTSQLQ
ncbi:MAG: hypothetical protein JSR33_03180 [Proteobacteria bacterium]|nr:hypothetical protein [Pseudomonadota bacterium]